MEDVGLTLTVVVMRVYDRGFSPPKTAPRLLHALKGYKNKNWPIKSAFYHGKDSKERVVSCKESRLY
jgi:hypothetical protein